MSSGYSNTYLSDLRKSISRSRYPFLHLRLRCREPIRFSRRLRTKLIRSRVEANFDQTLDYRVTESLEHSSSHFQEHGWTFIDNFLNDKSHSRLAESFPSRVFFDPPGYTLGGSTSKSYDQLYIDEVRRQRKGLGPIENISPEIKRLRDSLCSEDMAQRVREFANLDFPVVCSSMLATKRFTGTSVAPHKDGQKGNLRVNFIYFVDATGGSRSGGLVISKDNEMREIIFESKNLTNTCIVYNTHADFFHGFPPIARGKFRHMISALFSPSELGSSPSKE